jgi:glutamine cyclotransferase
LVAKSGQTTNLDKKYFGEGMAPRSASEFVVLTWKENEMFILNRDTMEVNKKHKLPSGPKEGWGITSVERED